MCCKPRDPQPQRTCNTKDPIFKKLEKIYPNHIASYSTLAFSTLKHFFYRIRTFRTLSKKTGDSPVKLYPARLIIQE